MKSAIIIHGMPDKGEHLARGATSAKRHWLPWIKLELEKVGWEVFTPEMPVPYEPNYERWSEEFEKLPLQEDTALIGHSCGSGFLVRWLSENKFRVGKVVLVAPWIDPDHKWAPKMFNDAGFDPDVASRTQGITEFISLDDSQEELDTLKVLKEQIKGLEVKEFTDKGHFVLSSMGGPEFPELRDFLI
jgi:uncharacterized protein